MTSYCAVEDGVVVRGPQALPNNWKNVSGLPRLSDEELKSRGWLPVVEVRPVISDTQKLSEPVVEVHANNVSFTYHAEALPTGELGVLLQSAVQEHVDAVARAKKYDTAERCISYVGDSNATFAAEAEAMKAWRSPVWVYCIAEQAKLEADQRPAPASIAAFIAELPPPPWSLS